MLLRSSVQKTTDSSPWLSKDFSTYPQSGKLKVSLPIRGNKLESTWDTDPAQEERATVATVIIAVVMVTSAAEFKTKTRFWQQWTWCSHSWNSLSDCWKIYGFGKRHKFGWWPCFGRKLSSICWALSTWIINSWEEEDANFDALQQQHVRSV